MNNFYVNAEHQIIVDELIETQKYNGYRQGWIYYSLLEDKRSKKFTLGDCLTIASKLGYQPGWGWHFWREVQ
ncbi:hypothetical protein AFK68_16575 [Hydrocoleum sp. CS-953]|uniref:hypothetical protein n=1 Tax=Hydrocoleum sp. CS-953 TaxID=1671698 RepID=UPI000B9BE068|nr:hypothetical protein [Hydrocoleum sp. CS-953]OZH53599.1 hypothetical protein AFK68_16575 [Hydrocoleum sp. CS-953]